MAALTKEDVKEYLRVDYTDDDNLIDGLMIAADDFLKGSIGTEYDKTSERAKTLLLIIISDLYDNRQMSDNPQGNIRSTVRKLVDDFSLQLRLEMRT